MTLNIWQVLLATGIAAVVWFILGGALYMNPVIRRIYSQFETSPVMKQWPSVPQYLGVMFLGACLGQSFLAALAFALVRPALPDSILGAVAVFGFILIGIKIFTRFFDMWIQTNYPNKLLVIEFVNGSIGSLAIATVFALTIG
jgi:cytochrome c oxidase assembly factor CtaG